MNGLSSSVSQEQINAVREQKLKDRKYFTVSLSHKTLEKEIEFRCYQCGHIVTTVFNQPVALVQVKITKEDAGDQKLTGSLCRACNIMFIFA